MIFGVEFVSFIQNNTGDGKESLSSKWTVQTGLYENL